MEMDTMVLMDGDNKQHSGWLGRGWVDDVTSTLRREQCRVCDSSRNASANVNACATVTRNVNIAP